MRGSVWNSADRGNILKLTQKTLFRPSFTLSTLRLDWRPKGGCVFPRIVDSILPNADFGPNEHWEDSTHFLTQKMTHLRLISNESCMYFKLIPGLVPSMTQFDFAKPFYKNLGRHKSFHLISIFLLWLHALLHRKIFATVSNKSAQRPSSAFLWFS